MNTISLITKYAQEKSGLTDEEFTISVKHAFDCACGCCRKFAVYIRTKESLVEWEHWKETAHPLTPPEA